MTSIEQHYENTLTVSEAAGRLGLSEATLRKFTAPGYTGRYPLPVVEELKDLTGEVRIRIADLDAWARIDRKPGRPRRRKQPKPPAPDSPEALLARAEALTSRPATYRAGWFRLGDEGPFRKNDFIAHLRQLEENDHGR